MRKKVEPTSTGRAIRLPEVCHLTALSKASVWRMNKFDPTFPKSFSLSVGVTCWDEGEILSWLASKRATRGQSQ